MSNLFEQGSTLQQLENLFAPKTVEGVWYNQKDVHLDGYDFRNCRFDNCVLHIGSGNFSLVHCYIDDSSTVVFGPLVLPVLKLFNRKTQWFYENAPTFAPTREEDGTITISRPASGLLSSAIAE